jgi:chorismate mutase
MTEEELDAAVDVISAVDAGVLQSLNQRIKQRQVKP